MRVYNFSAGPSMLPESVLKKAAADMLDYEGSGMSEKVTKNCDFLVKIPMKGKITSLNASVSAGIVIYEAVKQRKNK